MLLEILAGLVLIMSLTGLPLIMLAAVYLCHLDKEPSYLTDIETSKPYTFNPTMPAKHSHG